MLAARVGRWVFGLALLVYLMTAGGSLTTTDAVVAFDVTEQLVQHRTVALSDNLLGLESMRGRDGRYYSPFGIGQSLFNIPFYLAGRTVADLTGVRFGKPDSLPKAVVALSQALVAAVIVSQTFWLAALLTGNIGASVVAALALAFGSVLWPYAKFGFNQPLACATLLAGCVQAVAASRAQSRAAAASSGCWIAASLLTRHEMVIAAIPVWAWLWWSGSRSSRAGGRAVALAFLPGVLIGFSIWMALNFWRFGNPFDPGLLRDPTPGLGSSPAAGMAGLLFSPGASLFVYSPMALIGVIGLVQLAKRDRAAAALPAALVIAFLVFYATLGNWLGGRSYGSRYLVVTLPYLAVGVAVLFASAISRGRRLVAMTVIAAGVAVQLPGVLVDYAKVSEAVARQHGPFTTRERQWDWRASSIVMNTRAAVIAGPANVRYVLGRAAPPAIAAPRGTRDREFSRQFDFSLDFWWLYLFYLGVVSRAALSILVAGFAVAIGLAAGRLGSALRRVQV